MGPRPRSSATSTRRSGRAWHWVDRLPGRTRSCARGSRSRSVTLHLLSVAGAPAGYFELEIHADGSVEIAYFGLLPEFIGRGSGGYPAERGRDEAWASAPTRVWLHTCTLDAKAALPNYLARGFRPFKEERYVAQMPDEPGAGREA